VSKRERDSERDSKRDSERDSKCDNKIEREGASRRGRQKTREWEDDEFRRSM